MSKNRTESFESNMNELPNDLKLNILEYAPEKKYTTIVETPWGRHGDAGIDTRYNDLPEYQKDLVKKIWNYGTIKQVKYTLDRWYSKEVDQNWNKFIENYPLGNGINPYIIQSILEKEKWLYIGGKRFIKMRTKRRISRKRNTKKRRSKK